MTNIKRILNLSLLIIIILISSIGCNNIDNVENQFDLEKFKSEIENKGYNFTIEDCDDNDIRFLNEDCKYMTIGDNTISIYIYKDNLTMEEDCKNINPRGFGYEGNGTYISFSWMSEPHFYKKGILIVNYVGENEKLISDLEDIMGQQFAGM